VRPLATAGWSPRRIFRVGFHISPALSLASKPAQSKGDKPDFGEQSRARHVCSTARTGENDYAPAIGRLRLHQAALQFTAQSGFDQHFNEKRFPADYGFALR
jgi:hypothetical protein